MCPMKHSFISHQVLIDERSKNCILERILLIFLSEFKSKKKWIEISEASSNVQRKHRNNTWVEIFSGSTRYCVFLKKFLVLPVAYFGMYGKPKMFFLHTASISWSRFFMEHFLSHLEIEMMRSGIILGRAKAIRY